MKFLNLSEQALFLNTKKFRFVSWLALSFIAARAPCNVFDPWVHWERLGSESRPPSPVPAAAEKSELRAQRTRGDNPFTPKAKYKINEN